jgi:hypothetical protein
MASSEMAKLQLDQRAEVSAFPPEALISYETRTIEREGMLSVLGLRACDQPVTLLTSADANDAAITHEG